MSLQVVTVTFADANPVPVHANMPCFRMHVKADPDNSNNVYVGNSENQNAPLQAGESENDFPIKNANEVYIKGTAGEKAFAHIFVADDGQPIN